MSYKNPLNSLYAYSFGDKISAETVEKMVYQVSYFEKAECERKADSDSYEQTDFFGADWPAAIAHAEKLIRAGNFDVEIAAYDVDDADEDVLDTLLRNPMEFIDVYEVLGLGCQYPEAQNATVEREAVENTLREHALGDRTLHKEHVRQLQRELAKLDEMLGWLDSEYGNEPWRAEA